VDAVGVDGAGEVLADVERALLAQAVDGDAGDDIAGQPLEGAELLEVGLAAMVAAGGGGRAARLGRAVEGSVD
jgi:hypothetical protein